MTREIVTVMKAMQQYNWRLNECCCRSQQFVGIYGVTLTRFELHCNYEYVCYVMLCTTYFLYKLCSCSFYVRYKIPTSSTIFTLFPHLSGFSLVNVNKSKRKFCSRGQTQTSLEISNIFTPHTRVDR